MISDDDLREHFERQYAQGGPSADMARAVLDLFDERILSQDDENDVLIDLMERGIIPQSYDDGFEGVGKALRGFKSLKNKLRDMCVAAGLIVREDDTTDPLPLIRMFLPIEGD